MDLRSRLARDRVGYGSEDVGRTNQLLENVGLGGQWEAIIEHFIQKLIQNKAEACSYRWDLWWQYSHDMRDTL